MFVSTVYQSPIGEIMLASNGNALCGLWFEGQKYFGASVPSHLVPDDSAAPFPVVKEWLKAYFDGQNPSIEEIPLHPMGSAFRQAVWEELLKIPYGSTATYGSIANALKQKGIRSAPIAVGGAVGHNPISLIIPCHRVLGSSGRLTGYAGGLDKKEFLLRLEGIMV